MKIKRAPPLRYQFPGPNPVMEIPEKDTILDIERRIKTGDAFEQGLSPQEIHLYFQYLSARTRDFILNIAKKMPSTPFEFNQSIEDPTKNYFGNTCKIAALIAHTHFGRLGSIRNYIGYSGDAVDTPHLNTDDLDHEIHFSDRTCCIVPHVYTAVWLPLKTPNGEVKIAPFIFDPTYRQFFVSYRTPKNQSILCPSERKPARVTKKEPGYRLTQALTGVKLSDQVLRYGYFYAGQTLFREYMNAFLKNGKTFKMFSDEERESLLSIPCRVFLIASNSQEHYVNERFFPTDYFFKPKKQKHPYPKKNSI